jgi:hypothetical protein
VRHEAVPEPSHVGRRGLEPWDMWWLIVARFAACLVFMPVAGVPSLQGIYSGPWAHLRRGSAPWCMGHVATPDWRIMM